jgi:hypothetical protein
MEQVDVIVKRVIDRPNCTIGDLYIFDLESKPFIYCNTLEPIVRPVGSKKIFGKTAIPEGIYTFTLVKDDNLLKNFPLLPKDTVFPLLQNVPNFTYIYHHPGDYPQDTEGCTLVGVYSKMSPDQISSSTATFEQY